MNDVKLYQTGDPLEKFGKQNWGGGGGGVVPPPRYATDSITNSTLASRYHVSLV